MKRLLVIAAAVSAMLWFGVAPATARSLARGDDETDVAGKKKKHRDGGTRDDEEKEEDVRRAAPW
jgi:hypothetical protein